MRAPYISFPKRLGQEVGGVCWGARACARRKEDGSILEVTVFIVTRKDGALSPDSDAGFQTTRKSLEQGLLKKSQVNLK